MFVLILILGMVQSFKINVIGDWGRRGQFSQRDVAQNMKVADFTISVGDNFYPEGLTDLNKNDIIRESWLQIYYPQVPWYVALGNHDHNGNVSVQLQMHHEYPLWNMPSNEYSFVRDDHGFVVMDSTRWKNSRADKLLFQLNTKYKWLIAHHPLYSAGFHHTISNDYRTFVKSIMAKHNVQCLLSGHDHNLQYIEHDGVRQIISGAGASTYHTQQEQKGLQFFSSNPGFLQMIFQKQHVMLNYFGVSSKLFSKILLYTTT